MKFRSFFLLLLLAHACNEKPPFPPGNNELYVFPNPARDIVYIHFDNPGSAPYAVTIFDSRGDVVFGKNESLDDPRYSADVSSGPEGVYHVVLERGNSTSVARFIRLDE